MSTIAITINASSDVAGTPTIPSINKQIASTSDDAAQNPQTVGTSHVAIEVGTLTDTCACAIRNLHATAIVEFGVDVAATFYPVGNIPPGEVAWIPRANTLAGTYVESDTASTTIQVTLYKISP